MTRRGPNETTASMHARLSSESFAPYSTKVLDLAGDAERWAAGLYAPQVSASERAEVVAAIATAIVAGQALGNPAAAPSKADESDELRFTYRNWRGEVAERRVKASSVRMVFGSTEWHPEPQWLMTAIDLDKNAGRDFAWNDIVRPEIGHVPADALADFKALVDLVAADCMSEATADDPDEDSVGWINGDPIPMTFGHIRRAQKAVATLSEGRTADIRCFGPLSEIFRDWTPEEQISAAHNLAFKHGMVLAPAPSGLLPIAANDIPPICEKCSAAKEAALATLTSPQAVPLAADVVALVVAARRVAFGDQTTADIVALDAASEAFADRVPLNDEPPASSALDFLNVPSEPMAADDVRLTGVAPSINLPKVSPAYVKPIA